MIRVLRASLLTATLLALAGSVEATPIQFIGTFTPTPPVLLENTGDAYAFNHDLTLPIASTNTLEAYIDGVLTVGEDYDAATDTLNSGTLTLNFSSCDGAPCTSGNFNLSLGGLLSGQAFATTVTVVDGTQFDLSLINAMGILSVNMTRTNAAGTVNFLWSTIDVSGDRGLETSIQSVTAVPEPASLVLLGTGLIVGGVGARRRFRLPSRR